MLLMRLAVLAAGLVGLRLGTRRQPQKIEPWMSECHRDRGATDYGDQGQQVWS